MKPKNKWVKKMHARGWSQIKVAERWGMTVRNISYTVGRREPGWLADAINGLPMQADIDPATGREWKVKDEE